MLSCIVFDFDGTLVVSNKIKQDSFFDVTETIPQASQILKQILKKTYLNNRNLIFKELSLILKKKYAVHVDPVFLIKKYTNISEKLIFNAPEVPGAQVTLSKLKKQGLKLAISSATPTPTLKNIIKQRKIDKFFDYIYGAPQTKENHLQKLFILTSCKPSQLVLVGDSEIDQKAAKNVGSHFVGIGKNCNRFTDEPEHFLNDLNGLSHMLEQLVFLNKLN